MSWSIPGSTDFGDYDAQGNVKRYAAKDNWGGNLWASVNHAATGNGYDAALPYGDWSGSTATTAPTMYGSQQAQNDAHFATYTAQQKPTFAQTFGQVAGSYGMTPTAQPQQVAQFPAQAQSITGLIGQQGQAGSSTPEAQAYLKSIGMLGGPAPAPAPTPVLFNGQQTAQGSAASVADIIHTGGGSATNPYNGQPNPYDPNNQNLEQQNEKIASTASMIRDNSIANQDRMRMQGGSGISGLSNEDRNTAFRNADSATTAGIAANTNANYQNGINWQQNQTDKGVSWDQSHLANTLAFQGNDRSNKGTGLQDQSQAEQIRQYDLNRQDKLTATSAAQTATAVSGIIGAAGTVLGAGAAAFFNTPTGKQMLADGAAQVPGAIQQIKNVLSASPPAPAAAAPTGAAGGATGAPVATSITDPQFGAGQPSTIGPGMSPGTSAPLAGMDANAYNPQPMGAAPPSITNMQQPALPADMHLTAPAQGQDPWSWIVQQAEAHGMDLLNFILAAATGGKGGSAGTGTPDMSGGGKE